MNSKDSLFTDGFSTLSTHKQQLAGAFSGSSKSLKSDVAGLKRISSLFEDETLLCSSPNQTLKDSQKVSASKTLSIIFSLILSISGIVLFALGIIILFDIRRNQMHRVVLLSLNNATPVVPVLYYITLAITTGGFFIFLVGSWTLIASIKKSPSMLLLSIILIALLLLAQISLACISVAYQIGMHRNLKTELLSRLYSSYNMPNGIYFTSALDYIQTQYSCCGLTGDFDYQKSQWHRQHLGGLGLSVPRSCCALVNKVDSNSFLNPEVKDLAKCNKSGVSKDLSELKYFRHLTGCLDVIVDWARLEFLLIIGSCLGIGLLEGLGIAILIHHYRIIRKKSMETKQIISLSPTVFPIVS